MTARTGTVLALTFVVVLAAGILVQGRNSVDAQAPAPVVRPAAELKWADLDPDGAPGVKIADVSGSHQTGAFGAFLMLPAGFSAPLHTHTHDMRIVIVSGTYLQAPAGKPEFRLGPGSYLLQPGGSYQHTSACDKGTDCLLYVESGGAFDLHVADGRKTAATN